MKKERNEFEWSQLKNKINQGSILKGIVFRIENYGVFIELKEVFYGIILRPHLKDKTPIKKDDLPKIGESIEVIVLGFSESHNIEFNYISLSTIKSDFKNLL